MTAANTIRRITQQLQRPSSRKNSVQPVAVVTGPRLELSAGDPDQPFYVASIDKVFIATLIAQLFDDGHCSPDTPIGSLLPQADLSPLPAAEGIDNARDVTVQHLLSHTSGLADVLLPPRGYQTDCSIKELARTPERVWSIPELLQQAEGLPPFAKPGQRFLYSDTAYLLLIRIIEEAHSAEFSEQLRTRVFEPSGMADTAEWTNADAVKSEAFVSKLAPFWIGSPKRDDQHAFVTNLTWQTGLGGVSTANDLVRFQRQLHGGHLCDPKWVTLMGTPRRSFRPGIHYGTGMVALRFAGFSPFLRGYPMAVGGLGYTATHMFYYPQQRTHVILNFHSHRRMQRSFQTHIRLAGLIKKYG